ncbi:hypothetical protein DMENIID0001_129630 [Sergentomyia squamirostris]
MVNFVSQATQSNDTHVRFTLVIAMSEVLLQKINFPVLPNGKINVETAECMLEAGFVGSEKASDDPPEKRMEQPQSEIANGIHGGIMSASGKTISDLMELLLELLMVTKFEGRGEIFC